jgi:nucleotide-binding universal stress UspA family protein
MDLTDVLLPLKPGRDDRAAIAMSARLGQRHGARIHGLCVTPLPTMEPQDCYVMGPAAITAVMNRVDADIAIHQSEVEGPFRAAMREAGCVHGWAATPPGELEVETAMRGRVADLVTMTRPCSKDGDEVPLAACVIRQSGAPCLLIPPADRAPPPFDHIVVAWNGSRQAKRALDDALPFLRAATDVTLLRVGADETSEDHDAAVLDHLANKGLHAVLAHAPQGDHGRGPAILNWCAEHKADLLVMGAFRHSPQTERWLGGATWTILTSAHLPVLLSC